MTIYELRQRYHEAIKEADFWKREVERCKAELLKTQEELRPIAFEKFLNKKISEIPDGDNVCEITENDYLESLKEYGLDYVMFHFFRDFVVEKAAENNWSLEYYTKTTSGMKWTDYYDLMDTYGIRIHKN